MRRYIARLVRCGIPRLTAICICRYYKRQGRMDLLKRYVEAVEGVD